MEMGGRDRRNSVAWPKAQESLQSESGWVGYFQVSFFADIGFGYRGDCELSCALLMHTQERDQSNLHHVLMHEPFEWSILGSFRLSRCRFGEL